MPSNSTITIERRVINAATNPHFWESEITNNNSDDDDDDVI